MHLAYRIRADLAVWRPIIYNSVLQARNVYTTIDNSMCDVNSFRSKLSRQGLRDGTLGKLASSEV